MAHITLKNKSSIFRLGQTLKMVTAEIDQIWQYQKLRRLETERSAKGIFYGLF